MLVLAGAHDTIAGERRGKIRTVIPYELVLLQTREAGIHDLIVKRRAKDEGRPVSDSFGVSAPGTSLALWNTLLIDVIMSGSRPFVPVVICALVWIGQLAGLARSDR
jgi:hypothetical protein